MKNLEKKIIRLYNNFVRQNGRVPEQARIIMTWKDGDREFIEDCVSLREFDEMTEDDDKILFYFGSLHNMLYAVADLDDSKPFDEQDEDAYKAGEFEFSIVDIIEFL